MELERTLLRKVGEAIHRFQMIRDGDRVAVALSGGKDSLTLLETLLLLAKRAPVEFSVCAFTVEQGKFLRPIEPLGDYLRGRGIAWTYFRDKPSLRLLEDQPDHGCDLCSRYRRRAVYEIARGLRANVIAFGHTADDFCEALLRNTMFTGKLSALPPVTHSRDREFRLIRPLVFVTEDVTAAYAQSLGAPIVPCGCSQRTGTVRRSLREIFAGLEQEFPHLKENILAAMGNIEPGRLLDPRYLDLEGTEKPAPEHFPIMNEWRSAEIVARILDSSRPKSFTRTYSRILRPGLGSILPELSQSNGPLRRSFDKLDQEVKSRVEQAKLTA